MSNINDFEFSNSGWNKKRWDLKYKGEDKDMVIPEKLIAKAKGDFDVAIYAEKPNEIESIFIPKNLQKIWLGTLYAARALKKITVDPENKYLKDIDGVLFTKDGKNLIKAPCQKTGKYVVPEGVEEIESSAFQYSNLDEVILPESLKTIGYYGFQYSKLKKVVIPKGMSELEDDAFSECSELEEFSFAGDTKFSYGRTDMDTEIEKRISGESFTRSAECYIIALLKTYPNIDKCRRKFIAAAKLGKKEKVLEYLLSTMPERKAEKGTFEINVLDDGSGEIKSYKGEESVIEIPNEIDGKKILSAAD